MGLSMKKDTGIDLNRFGGDVADVHDTGGRIMGRIIATSRRFNTAATLFAVGGIVVGGGMLLDEAINHDDAHGHLEMGANELVVPGNRYIAEYIIGFVILGAAMLACNDVVARKTGGADNIRNILESVFGKDVPENFRELTGRYKKQLLMQKGAAMFGIVEKSMTPAERDRVDAILRQWRATRAPASDAKNKNLTDKYIAQLRDLIRGVVARDSNLGAALDAIAADNNAFAIWDGVNNFVRRPRER